MSQKKVEVRALLLKGLLVLCVITFTALSLNALYMSDSEPTSEEGKQALILADAELERNYPNKKYSDDLLYELEFAQEGLNGVWEFRYTPKSPSGGMVLDADVSVYVNLKNGAATLEHIGGA